MSDQPHAGIAVFLDRDGVLNHPRIEKDRPKPPRDLYELAIEESAALNLIRLRESGFLLIGVSNQPDIAEGEITQSAVERINAALLEHLPLAAIYFCPHRESDGCLCRKPSPGLILAAAEDFNVRLKGSFLIGDRWVDIAAARAAGIDGILLERPYSWEPSSSGSPPPDLRPQFAESTLSSCVDRIVGSIAAGASRMDLDPPA